MSKYSMILEEVNQLRNTLNRALTKIEHIEHICSKDVKAINGFRIIEETTGKAACKQCGEAGVWVKTDKGWRILVNNSIHYCKRDK